MSRGLQLVSLTRKFKKQTKGLVLRIVKKKHGKVEQKDTETTTLFSHIIFRERFSR